MKIKHLILALALGAILPAMAGFTQEFPHEKAQFSREIWAKAEAAVLLNDDQYCELLEDFLTKLNAREAWRQAIFDEPEMKKLNQELVASVTREVELRSAYPVPTRALKRQHRESTAIRRKIEAYIHEREISGEGAELGKALNAAAEKLYARARKLLAASTRPEATRALKMINDSNAVAIPRMRELPRRVKLAPMPLSDAELFAGYEEKLLKRDAGYWVLKSRCDAAFGILADWQELQLGSTPEGLEVLENYTRAVGKLSEAVAAQPPDGAEVAAANAELEAAASALRQAQSNAFRDDRQNKILTDAYYQARGKTLEKAVEILAAQEDDETAKALARKIADSMSIADSDAADHVVSIKQSTTPVTEFAPLEHWEKKMFADDSEYLRLKNNYYFARIALKRFQQEALSNFGDAAMMLNDLSSIEREIGELRAANAPAEAVKAKIDERNKLLSGLELIYQENVAEDPVNLNLQKRLASARASLVEYTETTLAASADPEAAVILRALKTGSPIPEKAQ